MWYPFWTIVCALIHCHLKKQQHLLFLRKMFALCTKSYKLCFYWEVMCFSFSFVFDKKTSRWYRSFHLTLGKKAKKGVFAKKEPIPSGWCFMVPASKTKRCKVSLWPLCVSRFNSLICFPWFMLCCNVSETLWGDILILFTGCKPGWKWQKCSTYHTRSSITVALQHCSSVNCVSNY